MTTFLWALLIFIVSEIGITWFAYWHLGSDTAKGMSKGILLVSSTLASIPYFF